MKVNEEIDALMTMGLDPMTMLVLPRMIAAMLVMPVADADAGHRRAARHGDRDARLRLPAGDDRHAGAGLGDHAATCMAGCSRRCASASAVAAIGCRAGLGTGVGPRAVGLSATAAVVGGIVATIALDGVFALIFYRLNL